MMKKERRERTAACCMALPEATENIMGLEEQHIAFKVREKIFAYYLDDHHDDGRIAVWCKAPPGVQQALVAKDEARFFVPPYVGPKGWIGIRLDQDEVDWEELDDLIEQSYRLIAPKRLFAQLDTPLPD